MNTPIADFVRDYEKKNMMRMHMPGHKGVNILGCESMDITEIQGADSLYEAEGIIAESEANATELFGTAKTLYSTEGSSQCIRAMLYLAMRNGKTTRRPKVIAGRNVHKAFVYAAAMLDMDVEWIWPEDNNNSVCSCSFSQRQVEEILQRLEEPPVAVYVTSPDYLGGMLDITALAEVCHLNNTILAVDNAHGAYLRFIEPSMHPIDLGADICCDSAHKTLPVLTGGAYLHISKDADPMFAKCAKHAMALFGSTSPSYLTLMSLDVCNTYLAGNYKYRLSQTIQELGKVRDGLKKKGWRVEETEPLKLTVRMPDGKSGIEVAEELRGKGMECEYADTEYVVCMVSAENTCDDLKNLLTAFGRNQDSYTSEQQFELVKCKRIMSIRDAIFSEQEEVPVTKACGCVCGTPTVSCPPAVPIVVSGEVIDETAIRMFQHYGITTVMIAK